MYCPLAFHNSRFDHTTRDLEYSQLHPRLTGRNIIPPWIAFRDSAGTRRTSPGRRQQRPAMQSLQLREPLLPRGALSPRLPNSPERSTRALPSAASTCVRLQSVRASLRNRSRPRRQRPRWKTLSRGKTSRRLTGTARVRTTSCNPETASPRCHSFYLSHKQVRLCALLLPRTSLAACDLGANFAGDLQR